MRTVFTDEKIDAVMHFSANSLVGESMEDPLKYYDNNVYGTQNDLQVMQEDSVRFILFSSTADTYGEPDHIPLTEQMITKMTNPFEETELKMEKVMKWACDVYGS